MTNEICLDEHYSTTKFLTKEKPSIRDRSEDKFSTILFLPKNEDRKGEGGLRTKGYFKKSYVDKPLVSIVTVVFNGEKYLEETIQSVVNQSYDNVEYIIIDGGSTDGTLDIIKKYDDQINYWVSEKDRGISDAFNKGIKLTNGDIIGILNADDWYAVNTVLASVKNIKDYDFTYGNVKKIEIDNQITIVKSYNDNDYVNYITNVGLPFNHITSFVKKYIYTKYGFYNINLKVSMDYDLYLRLLFKNVKGKYINRILGNVRAGGVSNNSVKVLYEFHKTRCLNNINCFSSLKNFFISVFRMLVYKFLITLKLNKLIHIIRTKTNSRFLNE